MISEHPKAYYFIPVFFEDDAFDREITSEDVKFGLNWKMYALLCFYMIFFFFFKSIIFFQILHCFAWEIV